jgi:hypothetical protein
MSITENIPETRFTRLVLGAWWIAVGVLGVVRLTQGDVIEALVLMLSASLTAALGLALSIDRARNIGEGIDDQAIRLNKGTLFFTVIAITTVVACSLLNGQIWWAALEIAAMIWILPAVVLPLAGDYVQRHWGQRRTA